MWLAILMAVLTLSPDLLADNRAAAEALFKAGRAMAKDGDTQGACVKFRESHRLDPALGTRLNLAMCEEDLGKLATAWQLLQSLVKALPPEDPRLRLARERLSGLEGRVPRVTLEASEKLPSGLTVKMAEIEITESGFGVAIPVDPGTHEFEVLAPGRPRRTYRVTLAEGEARTLRIEAPAPEPAREVRLASPRPIDDRAGDARAAWRTAGILTLGASGVAFAVMSATGLAAMERKETMDAECDPDGCTPAGLTAAAQGKDLSTVSTASFVAALALAGAGTTLLLVGPTTSSKADTGNIRVRLHAGGVIVSGAFAP